MRDLRLEAIAAVMYPLPDPDDSLNGERSGIILDGRDEFVDMLSKEREARKALPAKGRTPDLDSDPDPLIIAIVEAMKRVQAETDRYRAVLQYAIRMAPDGPDIRQLAARLGMTLSDLRRVLLDDEVAESNLRSLSSVIDIDPDASDHRSVDIRDRIAFALDQVASGGIEQ